MKPLESSYKLEEVQLGKEGQYTGLGIPYALSFLFFKSFFFCHPIAIGDGIRVFSCTFLSSSLPPFHEKLLRGRLVAW